MGVDPARHDGRMAESEPDLMTLLRRLDDPEWLEWPMGRRH